MLDGISIIICCFNSSRRISETINFLALQKANNLNWEIIIVDNASTDNTIEVCEMLRIKYPNLNLLITNQPIPGLTNARIKGVKQASYKIGIFCDDDNWLQDDFLLETVALINNNQNIGIIGAYGTPSFEGSPPPYFNLNQAQALAVGKQAKENGIILGESPSVYGAGMVFNIEIFKNLIIEGKYTFKTTDRIGNILISGGDYEICKVFSDAGYEIHFSDRLRFIHFIPSYRTELKYYKKLFFGIGYSQYLIQDSHGLKSLMNVLRCIKTTSLSTLYAFSKKRNKNYPFRYIHIFYKIYSSLGYIKSYFNNAFKLSVLKHD